MQFDSDGEVVYDGIGDAVFGDDDTNPWRYCGEYFDAETNTIYLRARHYQPTTGRLLSEDTHWNTANMIYGDILLKQVNTKTHWD